MLIGTVTVHTYLILCKSKMKIGGCEHPHPITHQRALARDCAGTRTVRGRSRVWREWRCRARWKLPQTLLLDLSLWTRQPPRIAPPHRPESVEDPSEVPRAARVLRRARVRDFSAARTIVCTRARARTRGSSCRSVKTTLICTRNSTGTVGPQMGTEMTTRAVGAVGWSTIWRPPLWKRSSATAALQDGARIALRARWGRST